MRELDPLGRETVYEYDVVDNLTGTVDRENRRIEYTYDDLDRLETETWIGDGNVVNYDYDKIGNLTSAVDTNSALTLTYDDRDRLKTASNAGTSGVPDILLTYEYDGVGNVTSVTDSLGGQNTYVYDALNRAIQIAQSGSGVNDKRVDLAYNNLGQFEAIDRYDDLTGLQLVARTDYEYDELNRLDRLSHNNGTDDLAFYDFAYDASSRITEIESVDGVSRYEYDDRSQLTEADHSFQDDETYSYDENGNRTNDGYATETNNRLQSDGVYNYEYDNEGNLIRKTDIATGEETVYTWDYRNRLVKVEMPSQTVEYGYDVLDRRISKTVGGVTTGFVYDGDDVLLEFENSSLDKRYLHGVGIDQVLAQEEAGEMLWHLSDHLGTVRDLVNSDGEVVNHLTYDSFGNVVDETDDTVDSRYLFTGREFDDEIGLYYYRARYYDGSTGRFISEDPIGFNGGDANLYRYVGNNSTNFVDPTGERGAPVVAPPPVTPLPPVTPQPVRPPIPGLGGLGGAAIILLQDLLFPAPVNVGEDEFLEELRCIEESSSRRYRCEFMFETFGNNPNSAFKTCVYNCRGYGAPATFTWPKDLPCPDSFDGNFPNIPPGYPDPNVPGT